MIFKSLFIHFEVLNDSNESWTSFVESVLGNAKEGQFGAYTFLLKEPMTTVQVGSMVEELCKKLKEELSCHATNSHEHIGFAAESNDIINAKYSILLTFND